MLDVLERESPFPGAARIGVTGAPGAGKSTLLDALVRVLRKRGETVAVVAVDPSSRQTGGALLGGYEGRDPTDAISNHTRSLLAYHMTTGDLSSDVPLWQAGASARAHIRA